MPLPTAITDLSTTAASNYPAGSDSPSVLDDVQRAHAAFIAQLRDTPLANITSAAGSRASLGSTAVGDAVFVAATAAAARTALGVAPRATRIDVASVAGTVDLTANAPDSDDIRITGALTVTGFTVAVGRVIRVTAGGAFTLTNNANIVTQTGANIVAASGDTFMLRATAANVVEVLSYAAASGAANAVLLTGNQTIAGVKTFSSMPIVPTQSMVRLNTANGYGSTGSNRIRRFSTVVTNQGTDITYADDSVNGATFTTNVNGVFSVSYTDAFSTQARLGLSLNSNQLTTVVSSITTADCLINAFSPAANNEGAISWTGYLPSGSVLRAHTDGGANAAGLSLTKFTIARVG
jgi:hypothetical protein